MAYSFSDPDLEQKLTTVAHLSRDSKVGVLRRLIEAEMKRIRRCLKDG
jgi:hypothetical protein